MTQVEIPIKQPKLMNKTLEAFKLVESGLEPSEALKAVNYTRKISPQSVSVFKKKLKKYTLTNPTIIKLAHQAIKDCLNNKPINGEIYPSHTNKLAAASMVYDRVEPTIKQTQNLNVNVDCHPVDLSRWSNPSID